MFTDYRLLSVLGILLLAFVRPGLLAEPFRFVETRLRRFAARRSFAIVAAGLLSAAGSALVGLMAGLPVPANHDEFSNLLAADTFASGRLSNPTHPMWIHFETFHVNQKPTYVSKYLPAQGMILAAGQAIFGTPVFGAWLSGALACAALCWMLQGWFKPYIAFMGAALAALQFGICTYWTQSYWGGMMPVLGGALVYGGLRRTLGKPRTGATLIMALGLVVLVTSRPYEGFLVSLPALGILAAVLLLKTVPGIGISKPEVFRKVLGPLCAAGVVAIAWLGYYNVRQTGHPLLTAYEVHAATYQMQPVFWFQKFRPQPTYNHRVLLGYYAGTKRLDAAANQRYIRSIVPPVPANLFKLWDFYVGPQLTIPLALGFVALGPWLALAAAGLVVVLAGVSLSFWVMPHYAAPMTAPLFILIMQGWRRLRASRFRGRRAGLFAARGLAVLCVVVLAIQVAGARKQFTAGPRGWQYERAAIEDQLTKAPGSHLVIVRYGPHHVALDEWVYNRADIDRAKVVWARDMDPEHMRKLLDYFRSRNVWLIEPDAPGHRLVAYH